MDRLLKNRQWFSDISIGTPKTQKHHVKSASEDEISALVECVINYLQEDSAIINRRANIRRWLKPYAFVLRKLV